MNDAGTTRCTDKREIWQQSAGTNDSPLGQICGEIPNVDGLGLQSHISVPTNVKFDTGARAKFKIYRWGEQNAQLSQRGRAMLLVVKKFDK